MAIVIDKPTFTPDVPETVDRPAFPDSVPDDLFLLARPPLHVIFKVTETVHGLAVFSTEVSALRFLEHFEEYQGFKVEETTKEGALELAMEKRKTSPGVQCLILLDSIVKPVVMPLPTEKR